MTPQRFAQLNAVLDRRQPDLTVLMDDVHKSHNLAAILRTCDAVGVLSVHAVSPGGEVGGYMAERAARISWQLDRADAAEHAELSRRVREGPRERERSRRRPPPAGRRGGSRGR